MKAIFARDVKVGDVIMLADNDQRTVTRLDGITDRSVIIHDATRSLVLQAGMIVALVHRPWPEGWYRGRWWLHIAWRARLVQPGPHRPDEIDDSEGDNERAIANLREAIEDYELGKPLEK